MKLQDLLSCPNLLEAIGKLYVMGFIPESKMNELELECRIETMLMTRPTTYRKDIYWQLSQSKDIPLSDNRIKNIDYSWRKPIPNHLLTHRQNRLKNIPLTFNL